jgi:phage terminase small subunit
MARPLGQSSKGLTQKQKNFCYKYVETSNATESYLYAYDTTSRSQAEVEGCKLLRRDDITAFITKLNQPMVNRITNEREKKRKIIWERINRCLEKEDDTAIARYMDILNKMDSEYVNINRNIDDGGEKFAELSTEQLKQILS